MNMEHKLDFSIPTEEEMNTLHEEASNNTTSIEINGENFTIEAGDKLKLVNHDNYYEVVEIFHLFKPENFEPTDVIMVKYGELGNRSIKPEHIIEVIKKGE